MDRGKRQGDRFSEAGACATNLNESSATNNIHQYTNTITNELAAANYNHQHNTIHQYIYYYQQTATRIPSNNESTAANTTQSVGKNANAGGVVSSRCDDCGSMQRRKMVLKLLKQDWPEQKLKQLFQQLCISPQERAEILAWNNLFCSHII